MNNAKKQQAVDLDREVRELVREMDRVWLRVGRLCDRCRRERLYQELGFERFDDWIADAVDWSRSRAYVAMRAARDLVPIRDVELDKITMQNAEILSRVPKSKQAVLVEAAQMQTEREFRKTVETTFPGLHLEAMVRVGFWVPRSLAEFIESCIEMAKSLNQTESRTTAIEAICAEYHLCHAEPEKERKADGENAGMRGSLVRAGQR